MAFTINNRTLTDTATKSVFMAFGIDSSPAAAASATIYDSSAATYALATLTLSAATSESATFVIGEIVTADSISMVVQDTNYREIPKFIELRDKLVKESGNKNIYVYFAKITNWGTFTDKEYEKKAVWKESHPNYNDLVKILNENVKKSSSTFLYDRSEKLCINY